MLPLLFTLAASMACHPVSGDRILARDLAAAAPEFRTLPPEEVIAWAPAVGARKLLGTDELARIARVHGLSGAPDASICFESPAAALDKEKVETAMRQALGAGDTQLEIVELSKQPAPPGEIVFPRTGLSTATAANEAPVLWRGFVRHGSRRFDIWARVKLGPPEIRKGDLIHVEAHNGAARLALDGQAQAGGRIGDRIAVRNPSSGKLFTATVAGRGRAIVNLGGGAE